MGTSAQKPETDVKLCSKCKQRPRAHPESTNPWCRQCNTEKQVEYQDGLKGMNESRGFAAGCGAMREFMAEHFRTFGSARFSGVEIWDMIRKAGVPR